jgi:hypothetical protein
VIRVILAALLLAVASAGETHAQDFERESRWRAEVVPGLVAGDAVDIPGPGGRASLGLLSEHATDPAKTTLLVIVHGIGVHPEHGIIGKLRMDLADKGFATLAIQMPELGSDAPAEHSDPLFANAAERIASASGGRGQRIAGADHFYAGREAELTSLIADHAWRK